MAKWAVPTEAEKALVAAEGKNPESTVVNRVGKDFLVFLNLKTREEIIIKI